MHSVAIVSRDRNDALPGPLARAGYRTIRVTDIRTLLALAAGQHIDVVLLHPSAQDEDTMPDMVRAVCRGLPGARTAVLPMLQRGDLAERVRSLWYGAANVVNLPLREDELLAGVASVIGRNQTHRLSGSAAAV